MDFAGLRIVWRGRWRWAALLLGAAVAFILGTGGSGAGVEQALLDGQSSVRAQSASGTIHIVEIDARSIREIARWPWPRHNYALLIDRLRRAGAASIAFDVDFSSQSTPAEDAAFAQALDRAGGNVVLPTMRQLAGAGAEDYIDSLPIQPLRDRSMAAAVTVIPDADGTVRKAPTGIVTGGIARPSVAAMLADRSGEAGQQFAIDYAINPATIPRHSFIDIRDGHFNPAALAGKRVLVGSTAIELGDRYPVPRFGVVPGVVIQALAAETLLRGKPVEAGWILPALIVIAVAVPTLRARRGTPLVAGAIAVPVILMVLVIAARNFAGVQFHLVPALGAWAAIVAAVVAARSANALQHQRMTDDATGLPNRRAMMHAISGTRHITVFAARIAEFDRLAVSLGAAGTVEAVKRIAERIAMAAGDTAVYRVEDRVLAWLPADPEVEIANRFEGLLRLMLTPVEVAGRRVSVAIAIGAAEAAAPDVTSAVANASLAASQAEIDPRHLHVHSAHETRLANRDLTLLSEMDDAIETGQVTVVYQPKLDIASGRIVSAEALVRWNHPDYGTIGPDIFVPLAERSHRIEKMTLYVIKTAVDDLRFMGTHGHSISCAVNISAVLIAQPEFQDRVADIIGESAVPRGRGHSVGGTPSNAKDEQYRNGVQGHHLRRPMMPSSCHIHVKS